MRTQSTKGSARSTAWRPRRCLSTCCTSWREVPFRRDGRQGEVGFSYSLLTRNMAPLARGLISLLSACEQKLEPNLLKLADDFEAGDVEYEYEEAEEKE